MTEAKVARSVGGNGLDDDFVIAAAVAEYDPALRRLAASLLAAQGVPPSFTTADDVVQDAWLATLGRLHNVSHPYGYVGKAVRRNVARAAKKARRSDPRVIPEHDVPMWGQPQSSPELYQAVDLVLEGIRKLPPRQQQAAYLRFVQDWCVADIAASLQVTESTAGVHVALARQKLTTLLVAAGFTLTALLGAYLGFDLKDVATSPAMWISHMVVGR